MIDNATFAVWELKNETGCSEREARELLELHDLNEAIRIQKWRNGGKLTNEGVEIASVPAYSIMFEHMELKAPHPITCLNPEEWFIPKYVTFDTGYRNNQHRLMVRGEETAWFNLAQCEARKV